MSAIISSKAGAGPRGLASTTAVLRRIGVDIGDREPKVPRVGSQIHFTDRPRLDPRGMSTRDKAYAVWERVVDACRKAGGTIMASPNPADTAPYYVWKLTPLKGFINTVFTESDSGYDDVYQYLTVTHNAVFVPVPGGARCVWAIRSEWNEVENDVSRDMSAAHAVANKHGHYPCRIAGCDYVAKTPGGRSSHMRKDHNSPVEVRRINGQSPSESAPVATMSTDQVGAFSEDSSAKVPQESDQSSDDVIADMETVVSMFMEVTHKVMNRVNAAAWEAQVAEERARADHAEGLLAEARRTLSEYPPSQAYTHLLGLLNVDLIAQS